VISEHMLLPDPLDSLIFPKFPLARLPFVPISSVQIDMVKLKHHRQFLTLFGHVLAGLIFADSARHLTHSAVGVLRQNFSIHFVHVLVNIGTEMGQCLSVGNRYKSLTRL